MTDNQLVTMFETILDNKLTPYFEKVNIRLDGIDKRLDKMDGRLDKMDGRLDLMDGRLDKMDGRLDKIDERLERHDNMLKVLKIRVDFTNKKLDNLTLAVKVLEHNIGKEIHALKDTQDTVVAVLQARGILPQTNDPIKQIC